MANQVLLYGPQFSHLYNQGNNQTYLTVIRRIVGIICARILSGWNPVKY